MAHVMDQRMRECAERCHACEGTCLETINHCLELGGEHAAAAHIRMLMACAAICETSATFMFLGSEHHAHVCATCAEICEACARECDKYQDDVMKKCAAECRRCAESCRQMAGGRK